MSANSQVDVIVIGAGAAGIAAARSLLEQGRSVRILEARSRVGGRVKTVHVGNGTVVDLGAAWLHSAETNPMTALAKANELSIDTRNPNSWSTRLRLNGLDDAEIADFEATYGAYDGRSRDTAFSSADDCALADMLEKDSRWNALIGAMNTWNTGATIDGVSNKARKFRTGTDGNWRVERGYGTLIDILATGLPVEFHTRVEKIDWSGRDVKVTANGHTVSAGRVVVTVPLSVLQAEAIEFTPALPSDKLKALDSLGMGVNNKIYFHMGKLVPGMEVDCHFVGRTDRTATGSYLPQPVGRPLLEMFMGADLAMELERQGDRAMAAFAVEELTGVFGTNARIDLAPAASSRWAGDEFSRGAYSYSRPGGSGGHALLAEPVENRLFFAGEACSSDWHSTVIGAWNTGLAAGAAAHRSLSA